MKHRSTNELRQLFLDYFKSKDHMIEPGASLVPHGDETLLWVNSGVAALKKYFDGSVVPSNKRIANAQKSIRTNDIENVGKTARHHTFFEMLGNFSIGDYFKKEAIEFAWEFLTSKDYVGMDKDKMYVSVHDQDDEAYDVWVNHIGFDPKRILKTPDNFWEIGEGPSGPNSELFYDRGEDFDPEGLGEKLFFEEIDNDRYLEVWNVVFSQYDAKANLDRSEYKELPQKNIDTGMGLERLACIVQEVETNFDTDIFQIIIKEIEKYSKVKYAGEYKESFKIISDHIRTLVFALSDGAMFSNEGRGYVLRRLLRRAVRHSKLLGVEENYLYKLVPTVVESMEVFYPELRDKIEYNQKLILSEEERFMQTLAQGEQHLEEELAKAKDKKITGPVAFKLYDTYGFPVELTQEIASESGYSVDLEGFNVEMAAQRERARDARLESGSMTSQSKDLINFKEESSFTGYTSLSDDAIVIGLFEDGESVKKTSTNFSLITNQTPFYAESGGQVGDTGYVVLENGTKLRVIDTILAPNGQHLHVVESDVEVSLNDKVTLEVDKVRREEIKRNHSSVHLVHAAIISILGDHVNQAGSFVNEKYARLDFNHFQRVSSEELDAVEKIVNDMINHAAAVKVEEMDIEAAKASGAMALFDEKYGDLVRVITMGDYSKELCGGTHVDNIAEIGIFKIISEESVGSGIRRLNFTTGQNVYKTLVNTEARLENIQKQLNVKQVSQVEAKVSELIEKNANLEKEIEAYSEMKLDNEIVNLKAKALQLKNYKVISKVYNDLSAKDLKYIADAIRNEVEAVLVILATTINDKVVFVVACDSKVNSFDINAGNIAKELAQFTGGNGGGRKDFAQSGGRDVAKVDMAIESIVENLT
ncbi:MAG TPA: alanine--tRNA ligase [Erysipelotrichaceae bacterium]|nr:alanine--tRNA ligase [Erysipelotrichaceae bacterium]